MARISKNRDKWFDLPTLPKDLPVKGMTVSDVLKKIETDIKIRKKELKRIPFDTVAHYGNNREIEDLKTCRKILKGYLKK